MADPYRLDFHARGNADFTAIISVTLGGAAYDLTGCTLAMELRQPGDISTGASVLTLANQTTVVQGVSIYGSDPTQGQVFALIIAATLQTLLVAAAVPELRLWYDITVTKPSGAGVDVPVEGSFTVRWGATR